MFDVVLFGIYFCGCKPRCALEIDNGAQVRLEKIFHIIKECDLDIHDISRTALNPKKLPRFNMPFEFGIFIGAKNFGGNKQKLKSCLIFDSEPFRYQEFISDISGQDFKAHKNNPKKVISEIRNWLNSFQDLTGLTGASAITKKYQEYLIDWPNILQSLLLSQEDAQYADRTQIIDIAEFLGYKHATYFLAPLKKYHGKLPKNI